MAVSEWGLSLSQAVSLTDRQVTGLMGAYIERKKFEAKITLSVVAEALQPKQPDMSLGALAEMGFEIKGA